MWQRPGQLPRWGLNVISLFVQYWEQKGLKTHLIEAGRLGRPLVVQMRTILQGKPTDLGEEGSEPSESQINTDVKVKTLKCIPEAKIKAHKLHTT